MGACFMKISRFTVATSVFLFAWQAQPAKAFDDAIAFTITDASRETAVSPGCPPSRIPSVTALLHIRQTLKPGEFYCYTQEEDVRGVAAYYAPYAVQAALSYRSITDDKDSLDAAGKLDFGELWENARKLLRARGWHFRSPDRCLTLEICENYQIDPVGLAYQIWLRNSVRGSCSEASIVFRGTVLRSSSSWSANLRRARKFIGKFVALDNSNDEYSQLYQGVGNILQAVTDKLHCRQIVSVGHSLGGGLAQLVALGSSPPGQISKAITFNASPETGVDLIVDKDTFEKNAGKLTIDRINQQGEVLSSELFKALRQTPASVCDPLIRAVEFNAASSSWSDYVPFVSTIDSHFIVPLAQKLVKLSYKGSDLVPAKLPPGNKESCKTRYYEEEPTPADQNMLVSGLGVGHNYHASADYGGVSARNARANKKAMPNKLGSGQDISGKGAYGAFDNFAPPAQAGQYGPLYSYAVEQDGSPAKLANVKARGIANKFRRMHTAHL